MTITTLIAILALDIAIWPYFCKAYNQMYSHGKGLSIFIIGSVVYVWSFAAILSWLLNHIEIK